MIRSDQISCSVVSDSLRPHESQHSRPPCPSPTSSPSTNQKSVHELVMPSLNSYYTSSHYPLQGGPHRFEGISLLWSAVLGKPIKFIYLFFLNSPTTLSLRFNSVPGYRNQIQLQLFNLINALFHLSSRMSQFLHLPPDSPTYSSFPAPFIFSALVPRHCMCKMTGLNFHRLFFICTDSLDDLSLSPGYKYQVPMVPGI